MWVARFGVLPRVEGGAPHSQTALAHSAQRQDQRQDVCSTGAPPCYPGTGDRSGMGMTRTRWHAPHFMKIVPTGP